MGDYPMGFRFSPTDEECIRYLLGFVTGNPLPSHDHISTADLYGDSEPWDLFGDSAAAAGCRYFFTRLKRVGGGATSAGRRFSRNVGQGTWSNKGQKSDVFCGKGGLIGHTRSFRYEPRKSPAKGPARGRWALKEYALAEDPVMEGRVVMADYVLCLLKKKKKNFDDVDDDGDDEGTSGGFLPDSRVGGDSGKRTGSQAVEGERNEEIGQSGLMTNREVTIADRSHENGHYCPSRVH
ncbi:NAC domain-containing protein 78 [Striga hermonthica]|uniref:NAC domain-containing protein 78 n=1 Tax=Striga hermonthica TaxID=68872 RepID=A0A9N7N147_STRHE|nr:NAC domain-containing protein 78 [Striga hermonthica]